MSNRGQPLKLIRILTCIFTEQVENTDQVVMTHLGQVVGAYVAPDVPNKPSTAAVTGEAITIGEALEATSLSVGDKPVDQADAAAIAAAEARATGTNKPGGIGAKAQGAVTHNQQTAYGHAKTTIGDVLAVK